MDKVEMTSEQQLAFDGFIDVILETNGVKVSSLYIAQIKRKYGIDMGANYNMAADPEKHVPTCPAAKEQIIIDAILIAWKNAGTIRHMPGGPFCMMGGNELMGILTRLGISPRDKHCYIHHRHSDKYLYHR